MPGSRGRVLDKFPQTIYDDITPAVPATAADETITGAFTEDEWDVPVTLSLQHSTLLEAGRFTADLIYDNASHSHTQLAGTSATTGVQTILQFNSIRVWIMNERRTGVPSSGDVAVLAYFDFKVHMMCMSVSPLASTFFVPSDTTEWHKELEMQDEKTGQGALIAQPRLYVYSSYTNTNDLANSTEVGWKVRLGMQYRNVPTPSGREFITELMAKFT